MIQKKRTLSTGASHFSRSSFLLRPQFPWVSNFDQFWIYRFNIPNFREGPCLHEHEVVPFRFHSGKKTPMVLDDSFPSATSETLDEISPISWYLFNFQICLWKSVESMVIWLTPAPENPLQKKRQVKRKHTRKKMKTSGQLTVVPTPELKAFLGRFPY